MGEIKQANFRINTDAADTFRAFCEQNGLNQAQGFDHLLQVLEMDQAKAIVPERMVEIEEFEQHTKAILSGYIRSLETAKTTEERVYEQFRSKLESKDEQIQRLQAEIRAKEDLMTAANTAAMETENRQRQAEEAEKHAWERMISAEKTAEDKAAIAEMQAKKLLEAEIQLQEYPALKAEKTALEADLVQANQTIKDLQKEAERTHERVAADLEQVRIRAELSQEKALAALEKEKNAEIQALRDKIDSLKDELAALKLAVATKPAGEM